MNTNITGLTLILLWNLKALLHTTTIVVVSRIRVKMVFQNLCILVLWPKVTLALEGLTLKVFDLLFLAYTLLLISHLIRRAHMDAHAERFSLENEFAAWISRFPHLSVNPSADGVSFVQCTKKQKKNVNCLNPVLVFIGMLSLSNIRWVTICQGFSPFSAFCHQFMVTKLVN